MQNTQQTVTILSRSACGLQQVSFLPSSCSVTIERSCLNVLPFRFCYSRCPFQLSRVRRRAFKLEIPGD